MNMAGNMAGMGGMGGNMGAMGDMMSGMPMGMNSMSSMGNMSDNIYASLLGDGAPTQSQSTGSAAWGQGQSDSFMGMGNPLMPLSSTNLMADQMGYNSMNTPLGGYGMRMEDQSVKSMQLNNDYEKKLAERKLVDLETNQPQATTQRYDNQMNSTQMSGMMPNMMGMMSNTMAMNPMTINPMAMNPMTMNPMVRIAAVFHHLMKSKVVS